MTKETSPCQMWTGAKNKAGYGVSWHNNHWAYAHRVAANALPKEVVRHICDNPGCVNPDHLITGTHQDNSQDMVNKGRQARGEQSPRAKLTEDIVLLIRSLQNHMSSRQTAGRFGITKTNVLDIWNRKIWKHI